MKSEAIKCEFCKMEIESEPCKFAVHNAAVEGKDYVFCCARCAQISTRTQKAGTAKDSSKLKTVE